MGMERDQLDTQEKPHINVPTVANSNTSCMPATVPSAFHVIIHKLSPHINKVDTNLGQGLLVCCLFFEKKLAE